MVDDTVYKYVTPKMPTTFWRNIESGVKKHERKVNSIADLDAIKKAYQEQLGKYKHQVLVCAGAGCVSSNCFAVRDAVIDELDKLGIADETKGIRGRAAWAPARSAPSS